MSRAIFLILLVTFLYSCSDLSSNDGSATEVGNPVIITNCFTSDSTLARGATLTIASQKYNPLDAATGEMHRFTLDETGSYTVEGLSQGEYTLTLFLKDSSEAAIQTIIISDTIKLHLQTEKLSSFALTVDNQSSPVTLFVPGTDIVKTITPNKGEILWENFPAGTVPGIVQQEGSTSKTVVSSFSTSSKTQVSLIATNDWYSIIKNKEDLDKFNFSGVYDITTMSTGQLWMGVGNGIYYNNHAPDLGQWAVYQTEKMPLSIETELLNVSKGNSDVIWLSGIGQIVKYNQGWSYFSPPADSLSTTAVTASVVVEEDLYLAYGDELYSLSNGLYNHLSLGVSLSSNSVITSATVVDSTMYLSSSNDGIITWQMSSQNWEKYLPSDAGMTSDSLKTLAIAGNGDVWSLSTVGLLMLSDGTFTLIDDWSGQNDSLVDVAIDDMGTIWILGSSMLYKHEQGQVTTFVAKDLHFTSLSIDNERGVLHIGHNEGLISKAL